MTFEEAMGLLKAVCADFRGTLKDHQQIQQALGVVEREVKSKDEKETKEE